MHEARAEVTLTSQGTRLRYSHLNFDVHVHMDDSLLAVFQGAFSVSGEINDTYAPHPHYNLYKQKREGYGDQESRRRTILEEQKARRRDFSDYVRKVVDGEMLDEDEDEMEEGGGIDEVDSMEVGKLTGL